MAENKSPRQPGNAGRRGHHSPLSQWPSSAKNFSMRSSTCSALQDMFSAIEGLLMGGKRGDPIIGASGPHGRNGRHACYGKAIGSMRRGSCYHASRSRSCCERAEILLLLDHMRLDETGCLKLLHHAFVFLTRIGL